MISIGTLKNFNSTDYRAEVQLAGSIAAYLDNIPVARNIASDQMIVGRHVILAIPEGNPKDACVIAVWTGAAGGGGGGGASTFLGLTDTPSSYAGHAGKYPKVNGAENALEHGLALDSHASRHEKDGDDELSLVGLLANLKWLHVDWQTTDKWTAENTGSASQAIDIFDCRLQTGTTSGSRARLRNTSGTVIVMRSSVLYHVFSTRIEGIKLTASTVWEGIFYNTTAPSDNAIHVGWKIVNGRIYASNGNGTNGTQTDTGDTDLNTLTWKTKKLAIKWEDANTAKFYIADVLVATHTTNLPSIQEGRIILQIVNSAAVNQFIKIMAITSVGDVHWG